VNSYATFIRVAQVPEIERVADPMSTGSGAHGFSGEIPAFQCGNTGVFVVVRKLVIALSVAAFLGGSVSKSNALPAETLVVGGSSVAGAWAAGGVLGVAAALCVYDLVLKFQGVKNWDGTAKKAKK
jgi:uncharacterized membrane protein